jgi:hypothetical protein
MNDGMNSLYSVVRSLKRKTDMDRLYPQLKANESILFRQPASYPVIYHYLQEGRFFL